MLDLKKIKVYGKDEEKTLDLTKINDNNNSSGDPKDNKLNELRGLVEDIKNKNKKYKKEYLVNKLNEIIKTHWTMEEYF